MTLKVIGVGFGRTGTASLRVALVRLGYGPCYHMFEIAKAPWRARRWRRIGEGHPPEWDTVFRGFGSALDWPTIFYYRELYAHYPDARFVLTVRDADDWYRSTCETIYPVSRVLPPWFRRWAPLMGTVYEMMEQTIWRGVFHDRFEDPQYAKAAFHEHIETVKRVIPAERLLVFNVKEGWNPLCSFLGAPVPEGQAFPHVNEAQDIKRLVVMKNVLFWLGMSMAVLGLGWLGYSWWSS